MFVVVEVQEEGPVAKWNQDPQNQAVQPGDRITSCNDVPGNYDQIVACVLGAEHLKFVIQRVVSQPNTLQLGTEDSGTVLEIGRLNLSSVINCSSR